MAQQLIDDNGVTVFIDDNGVTLFFDDLGNYLGDIPTATGVRPGRSASSLVLARRVIN